MKEHTNALDLRLEKLQKLRDLDINPYPYQFDVSHSISELRIQADQLIEQAITIRLAGRLMAIRGKGKAIFANLQANHQRLQIYVRKDEVEEEAFTTFQLTDLGDYLGVVGQLMTTQTGELTLRVKEFTCLGKSHSSDAGS